MPPGGVAKEALDDSRRIRRHADAEVAEQMDLGSVDVTIVDAILILEGTPSRPSLVLPENVTVQVRLSVVVRTRLVGNDPKPDRYSTPPDTTSFVCSVSVIALASK